MNKETSFTYHNKEVLEGTMKFNFMVSFVFIFFQSIAFAGSPGPGSIGSQTDNVLWLRADQGMTVVADGVKVSAWNDISGNNNHAFQNTDSKRPVFKSMGINNLPSLSFGGINKNLEIDDHSTLDGMQGITIFVVAKPDNIDTKPRGVLSKRVDQDDHKSYYLYTHDSKRLHFNTPSEMKGDYVTNETQILSALFNGADPDARSRLFQNAIQTGSDNTGSNTSIPDTESKLYIGILNDDYGDAFNGEMSEVIIYNRALNFAEKIIVETYLANRYAIELSIAGFSSTEYNHDFVGIGHVNGHKYTRTQDIGSGLVLSESNNSLDEEYEFVFAGHDGTEHGTNNSDLPSIDDVTLDQRWDRVYYIERNQNGTPEAGNTDINLSFHFEETGITPDPGKIYLLLYRENPTGLFEHVPGAYANISSGVARFSVSDNFFKNGYYTIARSDMESLTYYSYNGGGNWNDLEHWSLNKDSPEEPSKLPGPTDKVVIQNNNTITVNINDIEVGVLDVQNGNIKFGNTHGHLFAIITGQPSGVIELSADNFPDGDASGFAHPETGGTVKYTGSGFELNTIRTFRNMVINLDNPQDEITLLANYMLNGELTINKGTLRFGDTASETNRTLSILEDLEVRNTGNIKTGSANAKHQLNLYGDFINEGEVQFTNRTEANYNANADDGIVHVNFRSGTRDQLLDIRGYSSFYRIGIEKGLSPTYELHIFAEEAGQFALLGPANEGHGETEQLTVNNNALGLAHGTVRIGANIDIPRLNGNGNYNVSKNAVLWIDGGSVTKSSGTAVAVYGKVKITDGNFKANINSGITTRLNGVFESEGGITELGQFRTSIFGAENVGGYIQRGGEVTINGSGSENKYYSFTLSYGGNVFELTGGKLTINGTNSRGAIFINSDKENQNVNDQAELILISQNSTTPIRITSKAPFPNVIMTRSNTTDSNFEISTGIVGNNASNQAELPLLPLKTKGDLILDDNIVFDPKGMDVTIGKNLIVKKSAKYIAASNNTIFSGTEGGYDIDIDAEGTSNYFHDLTINNPGYTRTLKTSHIIVGNNLWIGPQSYFNTGTRIVTVRGDVFNSGSITSSTNGKLYISQRGRVHNINLTNGGSYEAVPDVTIEAAPGDGQTATAEAVFNGTPKEGDPLPISHIVVTNTGHGYTTAPSVTISGEASASAQISNTHQMGGDGNGRFTHLEVDEMHPGDLSQKITFLTSKQTVTGTMTLTNGILDLDIYNLDVEGTLNDNTIHYYSNSRMFRTAGNHGDGGLTRTISANDTYLFPIGTHNNHEDTYIYAWANPTFSDLSHSGKVQINGIPRKLGTLSDDADANDRKYLLYYWRVREKDFNGLPEVDNSFCGYKDDLFGQNNWANIVPGKVVKNIREQNGVLGEGDSNSATRILEFDEHLLETGEFTAGRSQVFDGEIRVFYSRTNADSWYNDWWDSSANWSYEPHTFNNQDDRSAVDDGKVPGLGDIAIIGYGGHNDRGGYHSVNIRDAVEVGKIEFVPHPDPPEGARLSRVVINQANNNNGTLDAGIVEGPGVLQVHKYSTTVNEFPSINADFSEFNLNERSVFLFYPENNEFHTIPNISEGIYPNLRLENGSATMDYDFIVRNNFTIDNGGEFKTNDGEDGDFVVLGDLLLGDYNEGTLSFSYKHKRIVEVGDIIFHVGNNVGGTRRIRVLNNESNNLEHRLIVNENIIVDNETSGNKIDLFTNNLGGNNVVLELTGDENSELTMPGTDINDLEFYRILVNKGNSNATSFTFNHAFTLNGPTDGASSEKALQLLSGKLVLDHSDIDIDLSTGGGNFEIQGSTALLVKQGTLNVRGSQTGILLDGLLRAENIGVINCGANDNNYIQYSASGRARLEIADNAEVVVGSQIRRGTTNPSGVLQYIQTGGTLTVGENASPTTERGIFEVLNTGSRFYQTNGTINIISSSDEQDALLLEPTFSIVRGTINFGIQNETTDNTVFNLNSSIPLADVNIAGTGSQLVLKERSHIFNGNLHIGVNAVFSGLDGENKRSLTLRGNITNENSDNDQLSVDTLYFRSTSTQTIDGYLAVNHLWVEPETSVELLQNSGMKVEGELNLLTGKLIDGGNNITVLKDVRNHSEHYSSNTEAGGMVFSGDETQRIFGEGQFGRINIDNNSRVQLEGNMTLKSHLTLTNGVLFLNRHSLTLEQDVEIISGGAEDFGPNKMIALAADFTEGQALEKHLPEVDNDVTGVFDPYDPDDDKYTYSFVFPMGTDNGNESERKYLPTEFFIANNSGGGSIRVIPVNSLHITLEDDPAREDKVLNQYWNVSSSGISNFTALQRNHYTEDAVKDAGIESDYIGARLLSDGTWEKFTEEATEDGDIPVIVDESDHFINFTHSNVNDISGDYTAGVDNSIPDVVPLYTSIKENANWTDTDAWVRNDELEVPAGGPIGQRIHIQEGHTMNVEDNARRSYQTQIDGRLEVNATVNHILGYVSGSGTLAVERGSLPTADYTDFFTEGNGSTVEFGGDLTYSLPSRNFYNNLTLKGTGDRSLPNDADFTINENWLSNDDVKIDLQNNIRVNGDMEWNDHVHLLTSYRHNIDFYGEKITKSDNAQYDAEGNNTLRLYGSRNKTITGNFNSENNRFNNLKIYDGASVNLNGDINLKTYLGLYNSSKVVVESGFTLTLENNEPFDNISAGSYVQGNLSRNLSTEISNQNHRFPLGYDGIIREFFLHDLIVSGYYTAQYYHDSHLLGTEAMDEHLKSVSDTEYWTLDAPSGSTAKAQLSWGAGSTIPEVEADLLKQYMAVAEWNNDKWITKGNSDAQASDDMTGWVLASDATDFSAKSSIRYLTLASTDESLVPLPIELTSFTAQQQDDGVQLEWVTASETNNNFFTIERSSDGKDYEVLSVSASRAENGHSSQPLHYTSSDTNPLEGMNYYRLKQTDFDGSYKYSEPIGVMYKKMADVVFNLFPNPNRGNSFQIALNGLVSRESLEVSITSMQGRQMWRNTLSANEVGQLHHYAVPNGILPEGVYFVTVSGRTGKFVVRMVVN